MSCDSVSLRFEGTTVSVTVVVAAKGVAAAVRLNNGIPVGVAAEDQRTEEIDSVLLLLSLSASDGPSVSCPKTLADRLSWSGIRIPLALPTDLLEALLGEHDAQPLDFAICLFSCCFGTPAAA